MHEQLRFVIVGHVDHGKSTLIGRLLYDTASLPEGKMEEIERVSNGLGRPLEFGFICDNLEEERALAQTIDTTQTFFKAAKRRYVIIDAPGHKELLKNMLTGASQADAAVLIVDAKEGIKEQTRRHAYLLGMLGIGQVIVVMNKMDLVGFDRKRFLNIKMELLDFLKRVGIRPMAVIPISAMQGDNVAKRSSRMPWYKGPRVIDCLGRFKALGQGLGSAFRIPIQDTYQIDRKRIHVGRVSVGVVGKGDLLVFQPSGKTAKVANIEILWKRRSKAYAGESIGITLTPELELARGEVASPVKSEANVLKKVNANVFWMSPRPLRQGGGLTMRIATQEIPCKVMVLKKMNVLTLRPMKWKKGLIETDVGMVEIIAKAGFVAERFDNNRELGRFVLVRGTEVVAGGIVTHF